MHRHSYCAAIAVCLFVVLACASSQQAFALALISNGGFETGSLTSWNTDQWNTSANWYAWDLTTTPITGQPTPGPSSGSYYAVGDVTAPSSAVLYQDFTVPSAGYVTVNWDMFINNNYATYIDANADLDPTVVPNQYCRVDILTAGSSDFATTAADGLVQNLYEGSEVAAPSTTNPYAPYSSGLLNLAPGNYMLRFGYVTNVGPMYMGVDNVSADYTATEEPVPEPGTLACLALGLLGLVEMKRRRRRA